MTPKKTLFKKKKKSVIYLEANFNPIQRRLLEKFRRLERAEKVTFPLGFGWTMFQSVQDVVLEKFLMRHTNFDRLSRWTVLSVPALDQRNV